MAEPVLRRKKAVQGTSLRHSSGGSWFAQAPHTAMFENLLLRFSEPEWLVMFGVLLTVAAALVRRARVAARERHQAAQEPWPVPVPQGQDAAV